MFIVQHDAM